MKATFPGTWAVLVALSLPLQGWGQQPQPERTGLDLHGDPLPEGAIARLGSVRFRHPGSVYAVAFSADGKLLAASSDGPNLVIIWDRATGRKLREIPMAKSARPPDHLQFSPDGKRLYGFPWDGWHAWDVETGGNARDLPHSPAECQPFCFSPDAREVILWHKNREIIRWDIEKGQERARYPLPGGDLETPASIGDLLLMPRFDDQAVHMWDALHNKQLWSVAVTRDKNYPSLPMVFGTDGKLFAVEAPARVISVYESLTGKLVRRLEADVGDVYYALSISPDGQTVAGSNWDGSLRLWDLETGRERARIATIQGWVTHVFFAPDSKTFATGDGNNAHAVLLWETATGKPIDPFPGHTSPVASVSFSPDGRTVATSSWLRGDPVVRLWDPQTGRLLGSLVTSNGGGVPAVAFSPDGKTLAACHWSNAGTVRIWDVHTGRERQALSGPAGGYTDVAWAPDGKRIASSDAYANNQGHAEGRLRIWNAETGKLVREIQGTRGAIQRVLFTLDGRHVLAAADGVHVYEVDTGCLVGVFQEKDRIWSLALSPDGRLLATADGKGPFRLWELATRREVPLTVPPEFSSGIAFGPDGRTLAFRGQKEQIVLFNWPVEAVVGELRDGDSGSRLVFSPDGRRLATDENEASSVLIWDVARRLNCSLPAVAKPSGADLRDWWADLSDPRPGPAWKAVWRFAAAPEQAVPFLADSLRPVKVPEAGAVPRWISDLDADQFEVRERASRELEQLGETAVDALRQAKTESPSAEQGRRLDLLLEKLVGPVPRGEQLQAIRAVAALEQIGGPEAHKILEGLAAGAPGACLTEEAKKSLQRLASTAGEPSRR